MNRLFTQHIVRQCQDLDGIWSFCTDPAEIGEANGWQKGLPTAEQVTVPSVWNTQLGLLEYEGSAWYERKFYWEGGCLRLCFDAVMTEADVWLDGVKLGYHYGGFTQFSFILPEVACGWHTVTVRATVRYDDMSIPREKTDWFHYGGITRSVTAEKLRGICVLSARMEYILTEDLSCAEGKFVLELYNADREEKTENITVKLGEQLVYNRQHTLEGNTYFCVTTPVFTVENPRLWDVDDPQMYEIVCTTDADDLRDQTGFRRVEVRGNRIYLNGNLWYVKGINRHEEHPDWGMAFPQGLMKRDMDILRDLGCNALRGSHYPNSQLFVDMLDSAGMPFWSEIPMWGNGFAGDVLTPKLIQRGLQMHQEMVAQYYNHPCILIWGMHNEIGVDSDASLALTETYYRFLKEQGGNRLVTYATCKPMEDLGYKLCDIICINRYVGWYFGKRDEWQQDLDATRQRLKELGVMEKPVIYSEFGGAAIYGHHTFDDLRGTEEYQAQLLESCMDVFFNDPMVAGMYVWQFCDIRTCRKMGLDRARTYNNKGILNEYRKPKMAYYTVKKMYTDGGQKE